MTLPSQIGDEMTADKSARPTYHNTVTLIQHNLKRKCLSTKHDVSSLPLKYINESCQINEAICANDCQLPFVIVCAALGFS